MSSVFVPVVKCCEKDKCINGYRLVSNSKLFAPFLPCRASGDTVTFFEQIDLPYASHFPQCPVNYMNLSMVSQSSSGAPLV